MGLKRSQSCDNHDEVLSSSKKIRHDPCDSTLDNKDVQLDPDVANLPCQIRDLENDSDHNEYEDVGLTNGHKVTNASEILPEEKFDFHLPESLSVPISSWIQGLPEAPTKFDNMSQTSSKRARSSSDTDLQPPDDDSGNGSRRGYSDLYKDPRYNALMEINGAFQTDSDAGPLPEEIKYCEGLLSSEESVGTAGMELKDPILDSSFLRKYVDLMRQSSELRLCMDLHARLVPSAEILSLLQGKVGELREGCNDRWLQAMCFVPKLPQPDRTVAFKASIFTDLERQKLGVQPGTKSLYAACEGMLFPFFTCEVKAGSEGLVSAQRANTNSMAVALRGVVDLFRRANMEQDVHRKILGITVAHNASTIELYIHYPEINGLKTAFYQYRLRAFDYGDRDGQDRYTCYKFVHSVYTKFAKRHLERLREAIGKLEVPTRALTLANTNAEAVFLAPAPPGSDTASVQSTAQSSRSSTLKAQVAILTQNVMNLTRELERQRQEAKEASERERQEAREASERQRCEAKEREASLMKLLSDRSSAA